MTRILVTGATGLLGSAVLARLAARGVDVIALSRRTRPPENIPGLRFVRGDLAEPATLDAALESASPGDDPPIECILHAAGIMAPDAATNHAVNVAGTAALLGRARALGARRFVYVSSVAVYGDEPQIRTREDAPRAGLGSYARSKIEAEDRVLGAAGADLDTCVLRPCPILGPGPGHLAFGIRALVRQPAVVLPDGARRLLDLVDAGHAADICVAAALDHPRARGPYNVTSGEPISLRTALKRAARALGTTPRFEDLSTAEALARNALEAAAGRGPSVPPELIAFASVERTYDGSRARETFGVVPRGAILDALDASVRACGGDRT